MALRFMDGCEHLVTADLGEKYEGLSGATVSTAQKRTGSASLAGGYGAWVAKSIAASGSVAVIGFGIYNGGSYEPVVIVNRGGWNSSSYGQVSLVVTTSGQIQVKRARWNHWESALLGSTGPGVVRQGTWAYVEWKVTINDSTGAYEVRVNGETVLTGTSKDTQYVSGDSGWDAVEFVVNLYNYIDDIYVCDGSGGVNDDFLGQCRVLTLLPSTGNGSNTDFTPSTGSDHGALVDEAAPNDDTDYVSSGTVGHVDTWHFPAVGYTGVIKGVQLALSAKKTDSDPRSIAAVTRPVSTNQIHGTAHALSTSYLYYLSMWEVNPEDSAAWEVADVDGAEFGVKVAA